MIPKQTMEKIKKEVLEKLKLKKYWFSQVNEVMQESIRKAWQEAEKSLVNNEFEINTTECFRKGYEQGKKHGKNEQAGLSNKYWEQKQKDAKKNMPTHVIDWKDKTCISMEDHRKQVIKSFADKVERKLETLVVSDSRKNKILFWKSFTSEFERFKKEEGVE